MGQKRHLKKYPSLSTALDGLPLRQEPPRANNSSLDTENWIWGIADPLDPRTIAKYRNFGTQSDARRSSRFRNRLRYGIATATPSYAFGCSFCRHCLRRYAGGPSGHSLRRFWRQLRKISRRGHCLRTSLCSGVAVLPKSLMIEMAPAIAQAHSPRRHWTLAQHARHPCVLHHVVRKPGNDE